MDYTYPPHHLELSAIGLILHSRPTDKKRHREKAINPDQPLKTRGGAGERRHRPEPTTHLCQIGGERVERERTRTVCQQVIALRYNTKGNR